jgi:hypothetical protein
MLTCRDITRLVTDYVEGRLSLTDRVLFQMHLGLCRDCRTYVQQVRLTVAALGALPPPEPEPEVAKELLQRFRRWKPP